MHTTTDRAALLQAILADPDDDGARLAFADLLEEEGERDRATLIRDQIQKEWKLAATGGPCVWSINGWAGFPRGEPSPACWRGANWFLSLNLPKEFTISRGFIESITCTAADWFAHGPTIVRAHPVTRVKITDMPIYPSGGNSTYYVGGLGLFPQEYWRKLDSLPTRAAALDALSAAALAWARAQEGVTS